MRRPIQQVYTQPIFNPPLLQPSGGGGTWAKRFDCPFSGWLDLIAAYAYGTSEAQLAGPPPAYPNPTGSRPAYLHAADFAIGIDAKNIRGSIGFAPYDDMVSTNRNKFPFVGLTFFSHTAKESPRLPIGSGTYKIVNSATGDAVYDAFPGLTNYAYNTVLFDQMWGDVAIICERPRVWVESPTIWAWPLQTAGAGSPRQEPVGAMTLVFHDEPY